MSSLPVGRLAALGFLVLVLAVAAIVLVSGLHPSFGACGYALCAPGPTNLP